MPSIEEEVPPDTNAQSNRFTMSLFGKNTAGFLTKTFTYNSPYLKYLNKS